MGLFSSRPELNNTWAAIPGEPVDTDGVPPIATERITTAETVGETTSLSIDIPMPTIPETPAE